MFNFLKKNNKLISDNKPDNNKSSVIVSKLAHGLKRTRDVFATTMAGVFSGKKVIDRIMLEELEEKLLLADVGIEVAQQIIRQLKRELVLAKNIDAEVVLRTIKNQLENILMSCSEPLVIPESIKPFVILFVGVNGSGKTTTVGKLAKKLQLAGYKIILAAGDTYRAAAIEQLKVWGERSDVTVIAQKQGSDSAAVLYDAFQAAKSRGVNVLIADTAGRLHTQSNLIEELKKIKRTLQKIDLAAPHEVLLVLDATVGQNALNQAKQFQEAVGVSGICLTKLDGTAKGGIIFAIAQSTKIPIRFIGLGESIDDLKPFNAKEFVDALFS
ncbi:Signal recognition particle receptor FtsY [Gammaproteobacteria bacterium]